MRVRQHRIRAKNYDIGEAKELFCLLFCGNMRPLQTIILGPNTPRIHAFYNLLPILGSFRLSNFLEFCTNAQTMDNDLIFTVIHNNSDFFGKPYRRGRLKQISPYVDADRNDHLPEWGQGWFILPFPPPDTHPIRNLPGCAGSGRSLSPGTRASA